MIKKLLISSVLLLLFTSCSKDKRIERFLRGSWTATKTSVESSAKRGPTDSSGYNLEVTASGTCNFNKDGTGSCQWEIRHNVKQGTGIVMMQMSKETNEFKWRIENENLIIEHQKKCHCNNKEERYVIVEKYEDMITLQSQTKSTIEVHCASCGGTLREQFGWKLTLNKM